MLAARGGGKWNAKKRFPLDLFSWNSTGPTPKASGEAVPFESFCSLHPTQPSISAPWPLTPLSTWGAPDTSLPATEALDVKHNAMHRPVSHIKLKIKKSSWITCMPSFVSMYQL